MRSKTSRSGAMLAATAALAMVATPASADHNRWGRRDRVDAGDVLTGILIIGGIAAIASAASKSERDRRARDRDRDYRYPGEGPTGGYDDRPVWKERDGWDRSADRTYGSDSATRSGGIERITDACLARVERDERRVEMVDAVNRAGDGWRVDGRLRGGQGFTCELDRDGVVTNARLGGNAI